MLSLSPGWRTTRCSRSTDFSRSTLERAIRPTIFILKLTKIDLSRVDRLKFDV